MCRSAQCRLPRAAATGPGATSGARDPWLSVPRSRPQRKHKKWSTGRRESGDPSGSRLKIPQSPETLGPGAGLQGGENLIRWGRSGEAARMGVGRLCCEAEQGVTR